MKTITTKKNAVTYPKGFQASALAAGIKKGKKKDIALLMSDVPAVSGTVFTINKVQAWPVQISKAHTRHKYHYGIFVNSGNANCSNGKEFLQSAHMILEDIAEEFAIPTESLFIASTGVIGRPYPFEKIEEALADLTNGLSKRGGHDAAEAILTTDTVTKELTTSFALGGRSVRIGAMAKGSGMMHPHMATMLVFITTDCLITKTLLQKALKKAVSKTFNRMSIDNDMSTNDTVFVLANGCAGNKPIKSTGTAFNTFVKALESLCEKMTLELLRDGEGVSKVCILTVKGARTEVQAESAGRTVANSMLFKTALHGADPNWGRILAAIGSDTSIKSDVNKATITVGKARVYDQGVAIVKNIKAAQKAMKKKNVSISIDLHAGGASAIFYTSDLSKEYISINADYTT